jgi:dienelactone hydrolase
MHALVLALLLLSPNQASPRAAADPGPPPLKPTLAKGIIRFQPAGDQKDVPERYRLEAHQFDYEMERKHELPHSGVEVWHVRFPSPVESPHKENNTVHAEYYRPQGKGPFPGVVVLDITGGDQTLSRAISMKLAQNRIAALFVQMAYYGPRRPAGSNVRLLSLDFRRTLDGIRQTVLDVRRAAAWLETREEIDGKRLGVIGTSLGSFIASLAAEMEPRFARLAVLLGGGGIVEGYYDHPQAEPFRKVWEALGGNKQKLAELIAPVDPLTCAANLKSRKVLIIAGKRDEIVPPKMAEALWKATGEQKIVWYDCGHFSAVLYALSGLDHVVKHFGAE